MSQTPKSLYFNGKKKMYWPPGSNSFVTATWLSPLWSIPLTSLSCDLLSICLQSELMPFTYKPQQTFAKQQNICIWISLESFNLDRNCIEMPLSHVLLGPSGIYTNTHTNTHTMKPCEWDVVHPWPDAKPMIFCFFRMQTKAKLLLYSPFHVKAIIDRYRGVRQTQVSLITLMMGLHL